MPRRLPPASRARIALAYAGAQARLPLGIAAAYDGRVLGKLVRSLAGTTRAEESLVGGVEATVYRPGRGRGPWPCVVVLPGVTRQGRAHPAFRAIGRCLAATGHLAVVAEPEGLAVGELTPTTFEQARSAAEGAALLPQARGERLTHVGVSGGATLALLVAADANVGPRVRHVTSIAPCCDLGEALRLVTTGVYRHGGRLDAFSSGGFFRLVIARSAVAWLRPSDDRKALRSHLLSLADDDADPLAGLRAWPRRELGAQARALVELLANEEPECFDELFAALPPDLRANVALLSPSAHAARVERPVEVVVPRADKYIPLADAARFAEACPTARLTVLDSLSHVVPTVSPFDLRGLAQLDAVLVRLFAAARSASYS